MVDLYKVPIHALRFESRSRLKVLNLKMILPSEDNLFRDWRGILQLLQLNDSLIMTLDQNPDPFDKLLRHWVEIRPEEPCLGRLLELLKKIDREDVYEDTRVLFRLDAEVFQQNPSLPLPGVAQFYHAILIYDDQDEEMAQQVVGHLEPRGLSIMKKDRDLLPGIFEHQAMMELIRLHCQKVIVIISRAFLVSVTQDFLARYAQHVSIENGARTIVPLMIEECPLPTYMNFLFPLRLYRKQFNKDPMQRLYEAVTAGSDALTVTRRLAIELPEKNSSTEKLQIMENGEHPQPDDASQTVSSGYLSTSKDSSKIANGSTQSDSEQVQKKNKNFNLKKFYKNLMPPKGPVKRKEKKKEKKSVPVLA